jgi:hypothetical protein
MGTKSHIIPFKSPASKSKEAGQIYIFAFFMAGRKWKNMPTARGRGQRVNGIL